MKNYLLLAFLLFWGISSAPILAQTTQVRLLPDCETPKDGIANLKALRQNILADATPLNMNVAGSMARPSGTNNELAAPITLRFPLRIGVISNDAKKMQTIDRERIIHTIDYLNDGFYGSHVEFYIDTIETIPTPELIEDLSQDGYLPYIQFSRKHDRDDVISLYLFDYNPNFCEVTTNSISCGRQAGFSYVLSGETNNVVLSKFDLEDYKVIVHEFGHFFGLYHTFEEKFGAERPDATNCREAGDQLCDTPADPGNVYEVYVNYSNCEMVNHFDNSTQSYYKPLINNYMSYYKPCYLQPYSFTAEQRRVLYFASRSRVRAKFAR
jgi:hypothetical protein